MRCFGFKRRRRPKNMQPNNSEGQTTSLTAPVTSVLPAGDVCHLTSTASQYPSSAATTKSDRHQDEIAAGEPVTILPDDEPPATTVHYQAVNSTSPKDTPVAFAAPAVAVPGQLNIPSKSSHRQSRSQKKESDSAYSAGDSGISASSSPARTDENNATPAAASHTSSSVSVAAPLPARKCYDFFSADAREPVVLTSPAPDVPTIVLHAVSPTNNIPTFSTHNSAKTDKLADENLEPNPSSHLLHAMDQISLNSSAHSSSHQHVTVGRCHSCANPGGAAGKNRYDSTNATDFDDFPSSASSSPYFETRFPQHRKSEPTILSYAATLAQSAVSPYEAPAWLIHMRQNATNNRFSVVEPPSSLAQSPICVQIPSISSPSIPVAVVLAGEQPSVNFLHANRPATSIGGVLESKYHVNNHDERHRRSFSMKHGVGRKFNEFFEQYRSAERVLPVSRKQTAESGDAENTGDIMQSEREKFYARTNNYATDVVDVVEADKMHAEKLRDSDDEARKNRSVFLSSQEKSQKQDENAVEQFTSTNFDNLTMTTTSSPPSTVPSSFSSSKQQQQQRLKQVFMQKSNLTSTTSKKSTNPVALLPPPATAPVTASVLKQLSPSSSGTGGGGSAGSANRQKLAARKSTGMVAIGSTQSSPTKTPTKARRTWRKVFLAIRLHNNFCRAHFTAPVAGHHDSVRAGAESGTILKRFNDNEWSCLKQLMSDQFLRPFVPQLLGLQRKSAVAPSEKPDVFIKMADLLYEFETPCVMDCKIGVRTYLETELEKARKKPVPRPDMYQKMIALDASAPTPDEHASQSVVKARYMMWREQMSSTSTLGFRIEGMLLPGAESQRDFKKTKLRQQVKQAFDAFARCVWLPPASASSAATTVATVSPKKQQPPLTSGNSTKSGDVVELPNLVEESEASQPSTLSSPPPVVASVRDSSRYSATNSNNNNNNNDAVFYDHAYILGRYLTRLEQLRAALELSPFFATHEVIGSSLLFVHDHSQANVWMIDFVNTVALPTGVTVNHRNEWREGNHEDGYLTGLDHIISIFSELYEKYSAADSSSSPSSPSSRSAPDVGVLSPLSPAKIDAAAQKNDE